MAIPCNANASADNANALAYNANASAYNANASVYNANALAYNANASAYNANASAYNANALADNRPLAKVPNTPPPTPKSSSGGERLLYSNAGWGSLFLIYARGLMPMRFWRTE